MNGDQMYEQLTNVYGLTEEDYGHLVIVTDCWTGAVCSAVLHPDPEKQKRSITMIVAAAAAEMMAGKVIAGGAPTLVADPWKDWREVCNEAIDGAIEIAVSYTADAFDQIGFSLTKFREDHNPDLSDEDVHAHLDTRLNYALARKAVNAQAAAAMDIADEALRKAMIAKLDMSYRMLDMTGEMLHEIDGQ